MGSDRLTLEETNYCARPLYMLTGTEGYEVGQIGSGTLLKHEGRLLVATARHCLRSEADRSEEEYISLVGNLWIPQSLEHFEPYTVEGVFFVERARSLRAASDLAIIQIHAPHSDSNFCDLDSVPMHTPSIGDRLMMAGYPKATSMILPLGPQKGEYFAGPVVLSGICNGEGTAPGLLSLRIEEPLILSTCDGMSGCPVFLVYPPDAPRIAALVGIAVREMQSTGCIDFIPATGITAHLSSFSQQVPSDGRRGFAVT